VYIPDQPRKKHPSLALVDIAMLVSMEVGLVVLDCRARLPGDSIEVVPLDFIRLDMDLPALDRDAADWLNLISLSLKKSSDCASNLSVHCPLFPIFQFETAVWLSILS
jgi:hypothetical protein